MTKDNEHNNNAILDRDGSEIEFSNDYISEHSSKAKKSNISDIVEDKVVNEIDISNTQQSQIVIDKIDLNDIPVFVENFVSTENITQKIITGVDWNILTNYLNEKNYQEQICSEIFKSDRLWKDRDTVIKIVKEYSVLTGFTLRIPDKNTLQCNRFGIDKTTRDFSAGPLKCDCTWRLKIVSTRKINRNSKSKLNNTTYISKVDDFSTNAPVMFTKTCNYCHKLPCIPSATQQKFTNKASGKYVTNISDYATFTLCALLQENPNLNSSSIKTILKSNFPKTKEISHSDIYNTKIRCFRLMKIYEESNNDYVQFCQSFKKTKLIKSGLDFQDLNEDEACSISKLIWNDIMNKKNNETSDDDFINLKLFMNQLCVKCKGFTYRFAYGNNNKVNGVVWMTGTMRDNFKRFGSYISLDAMKRATNTFLWHYFSTVLINDLNKVCVGSEGIIISERTDAYQFLIDSTIDMCNNVRSKENIYCVSGDGFFNNQSLQNWGLTNAQYICDHWHLFNSSLSKNFGEYYYNQIEGSLRQMALSNNEDDFNKYYNMAKNKLHHLKKRNYQIEKKLDDFANEKDTYAKYLIHQIPGNLMRFGSTQSEQNHSSVLSHLNQGSRKHNYLSEPYTLIKDLLVRQESHLNKFNESLANQTNLLYVEKSKLERDLDIDLNIKNVLLKASNHNISFLAYSKFKQEVIDSRNYYLINNNDGTFNVSRIGIDSDKTRHFKDKTQRCSCTCRVSNLIQCRHEFVLHNKFNIDLFDIRNHYRHKCQMIDTSEHDNIQINKKTNIYIDDDDDDDDVSYSNTQLSSQLLIDNSQSDVSVLNNSTNAANKFNINDILKPNAEIASKFKNSSSKIQLFTSSILIQLNDLLSFGENSTRLFSNFSEDEIINEKYKQIVDNYKQTFANGSNGINLNLDEANILNKDLLKSQAKNRFKSRTEINSNKYNKRRKMNDDNVSIEIGKKTPKKCSFCNGTLCVTTTCPKREAYKIESNYRELLNDTQKRHFLEELKVSPTQYFTNIGDIPNIYDDVFIKYKTKIKHLLVYNTYPSPGIGLNNQHWDLSKMVVMITPIDFNGDVMINMTKILVTGSSFEEFMIGNYHNRKKFIYKCT